MEREGEACILLGPVSYTHLKDADPALVEPLLAACRAVGVPAVTEFTMSQLGRAAGIAVGTAAAAVPSR